MLLPRKRLAALVKHRDNQNLTIAEERVDDRVRETPQIAVPIRVSKTSPHFRETQNPIDGGFQFIKEIRPKVRTFSS